MSINFIPNDPKAGTSAPGIRQQAKHANRPTTKSRFTFPAAPPEGLFQPGTANFLFWQCREAALRAMDAWESSVGAHKKWQGNRTKLPVRPDQGIDLNAFYDRVSFSFFHQQIGAETLFSGASTDVVAHEVGHGLLDSIRPDFFDVDFLEVGALHEAFGDCIALLTALGDKSTRQKLLTLTTTLRKKNFVESTAEDLSRGIRLLAPNHNAAEPRHAFNKFKYQLPSTLPSNGGPGKLINEVHSFGMLFSGCFWDLIANLFGQMAKTEANLLTAARTAGKILIEGLKVAVVTPRFLQSAGRAMVLADQSINGGANRDLIRNAFEGHNILLGSNALLAPAMALEGSLSSRAAALAPATRRDLANRIGAPRGAKLQIEKANMFGTPMVRATHTREVSLAGLDKSLKGVVALAPEPVMVRSSGAMAAVVGNLPNQADTESEVHSFVKSLLDHDRITFGKAAKPSGKHLLGKTHKIESVGGKKVLRRVRFICGEHQHC